VPKAKKRAERTFHPLSRSVQKSAVRSWEHRRNQLAYRLDLRQETSLLRWLGRHHVSAYTKYNDIQARQYLFRDSIVSNHTWTDTTTNRGASSSYNIHPRFYIADGKGHNVDYGSTAFNAGTYALRWGNAVTQQFVSEPIYVATAIADEGGNGNGGVNNNRTILKSQGTMLQSFLVKDRLVTTFGLRSDQRYCRTGAKPLFLNGLTMNEDSFNQWADGDGALGKGKTTTAGTEMKALPWLTLTGNKSATFQPAALGYDLYRKILPDPTGAGPEFGFSLNLFENKLTVRVIRYKTVQINSRNGDSGQIAQRVHRLDFSNATSMALNLQSQATQWLTEAARAKGVPLTTAQLNQHLADTMGLPLASIAEPSPNGTAHDDLTARGTEIEVNSNPNQFWTMKLNVAQHESINSALSGDVGPWIADRLPVWTKIIAPRNNLPWWTQPYSGQSPLTYFTPNLLTPLQIARAMQGKSRPPMRQYRANFLTNYRLAGLTDQRLLKRLSVGGAVRWEDRGSIGFRGVPQVPAVITALDVNQPIWDKSYTYLDTFAAYRTKLFADKAGLTLQINARNVIEPGHLQPVAVEADGRVSAYRIIDPRLFILTATFSL